MGKWDKSENDLTISLAVLMSVLAIGLAVALWWL